MADPFDSSTLFAEFNRPRLASDRILMSKLKDKNQTSSASVSSFGINSEKTGGTNQDSGSSSSSSDESGSDDGSDIEKAAHGIETNGDEDDGPVEIGKDEAGYIRYRPGRREREVGMKLLQNADYGDGQMTKPMSDNKGSTTEEIEKVRATNEVFRKQTRLIDPTRHIPATEHQDGPAVQILFMNNDFARRHRGYIERFISDLLMTDRNTEPLKPIRIRPHHICVAKGAAELRDQETAIHEHRTSTVIGSAKFYSDFVVDSMGFPLVDYIPALSDGWEIPYYMQQFQKAMPVESDSEDEDRPPKPQKQGPCCFNCGGAHRLSDCQEQRDFQRIAANRQKFQEKGKQQPQGTLNRGIVEENSRFSGYKPGVYSDSLLEALGVQKNHLPFFVYKMREMGYPPGYLIAAEVEHSGISMFGKHGQVMKDQTAEKEDGSLEDGETGGEVEEDQVLYNVDKLVGFPGFNVPLPEGVPDEAHIYGFPPMQQSQSMEVMRTSLPTPKGVKRHHSRSNEGLHGGKRRRLEDDMDLDNSGMEPPISRSSSTASFATGRSDTPTLEDLEAQQRLLREQLEEAEDSQGSNSNSSLPFSREGSTEKTDNHRFTVPEPPGTPGGNPPLPSCAPPDTPPNPPLPPGTPPVTPGSTPVSGTPRSSTPPDADPFTTPIGSQQVKWALNKSGSASIEKTMGTPVRKVNTDDLPDSSKFTVGVQDHIPFENLPNATGTYDKMKDVIAQIRRLKKKSL